MEMRIALVALLLASCSSLKTPAAEVEGEDAGALSDAAVSPKPEPSDGSEMGPKDAALEAAPAQGCTPACAAPKICVEGDAGSRCEVPTIRWYVDGVLVAQYATHEGLYTASSSVPYYLAFPFYGRNISLTLPATVGTGNVLSCPSSGPVELSLNTSDNGFAGLSALPARWKGLILTRCGTSAAGDQVMARDVTLSVVTPARVAGTYEFIVQGAGPRAGSTLRVTGAFDVAPVAP